MPHYEKVIFISHAVMRVDIVSATLFSEGKEKEEDMPLLLFFPPEKVIN